MPYLDIIVPIKNEAKNLNALVNRVEQSMSSTGIKYRLIFVDDQSTDNSLAILKELKKNYPILVFVKKGKPGKAFSIMEGARYSKAEYLAMIDGDLQYPPEIIPEMLQLTNQFGVVIAKRKNYQDSLLRKLFSHTFSTIFGKLLHNLPFDIQSGLKVFKREILLHLDTTQITPWSLDLSLLTTARELGYQIGEVDIVFDKRRAGSSKVNLVKSTWEIASGAVKLKLKAKKIFPLVPTTDQSMIGAGVIFKQKRFITHTTLPSHKSAIQTFQTKQKLFISLVLLTLILGLLLNFILTAIVFIGLLSLVYFIDVFFNLFIILKSLHLPPELGFSKNKLNQLDNQTLPKYTILCPLYKEARILPHFVKSINKLDWPKDKLEVLLLLEQNDTETINKARSLNLPSYFKTLIVPDSQPKTKPKACNYGLNFATGEYLVIYDAEDQPESDQLKMAYLAFQQTDPKTVCLQAKLNYFNHSQNFLTKFFTAEYSLWFDVILSGLQSISTTIPLGGTSNHFKTALLKKLQGWDPFNVTEDCDLGARLFYEGYQTALIDSTTYEEANSNLKNWIRQRSRWIKGYMQTYLVHMRNPIGFVKRHGVHALIFQLIIGARISFMLINPLLWIITASYFLFYPIVGPTIETLYPNYILYIAVFSLIFGNFIYLYDYMIGCARRNHWQLIKYVYLIPIYWLFASVAAYVAFYQLLVKPHYWEKTIHGLHLNKPKLKKTTPLPKLVFEPI